MEIRLLESRMGIESFKKEHAMGKPVSIDQSHAVISALANNVDWSVLDGDVLQTRIIKNPREAGTNFTLFLKNGAQVGIGGKIPIDRSKPFNVAEFLGEDWTIVGQDERSLVLAEVDPAAIRLESMLKDGENSISCEEKLRRLKKAGYIRLDAKVFQTFCENPQFLPECWKERVSGDIRFISFDGTIFRDPNGNSCSLYLYWGGGVVVQRYRCFDDNWGVRYSSAVLAAN